MPTGYTAKLMEKGQTFEEFVLTCARAFGACIEMRDDSLETPIPEKFVPSKYHVGELAKAKKDLADLESMTKKERVVFGQKRIAEQIRSYETSLAKDKRENKRLEDMEYAVLSWFPPTKDHEELQKFMLEQIRVSKNNIEYSVKALKNLESADPLTYHTEAITHAKWSVDYHTKEQTEELTRITSRNEWIRQLRDSLKKKGATC